MNSKFLKKIIIIILIIIIIMSIICFVLINMNKKKIDNVDSNKVEDAATEEMSRNAAIVSNQSDYYTIKACIDSYYNSIIMINESNIEDEEEYASRIIDVLNTEYMNSNDINNESVLKKYKNYDYREFNIENMYVTDYAIGMSSYFVYGKQINIQNNVSEKYGFLVTVDFNKTTYSIAPYEYMIDIKCDVGNENNIKEYTSNINNIEKNNYNLFFYKNIEDSDIIKNLVEDYKINLQLNIEKAYKLLDANYSQLRFDNLNEFKKFVNEDREILLKTNIEKYSVNKTNEYTEYICKDSYDNYLIFRETNPMEYSIFLDIYTIEREDVIFKYKDSSNKNKVIYNLDKFRQMINRKDFKSAYNVLDTTFKKDKFGSVENFKNYIKNNWYNCIKFINVSDEENSSIYSVTVYIINGIEDNQEKIDKTFIIKLNEGTDFVMSFNV